MELGGRLNKKSEGEGPVRTVRPTPGLLACVQGG